MRDDKEEIKSIKRKRVSEERSVKKLIMGEDGNSMMPFESKYSTILLYYEFKSMICRNNRRCRLI